MGKRTKKIREQTKVTVTPKLGKEIKKKIKEKIDWRNMRIMWHSVAPFISSGYGIVTRNTVGGLLNRGFVPFISCYYGLQKGGIINYKGMITLPVRKSMSDKLGFKTVGEHYRRFKCDVGIFHADFWVSFPFTKEIPNSILYSPLDQEDYPQKWLEIIRHYRWVAVPSKHARAELAKSKIKSTFIPHGVDTKIYKPLPKEPCRKLFTLKKDRFVIGIVGANSDDETRKGWGENFKAVKIFLDNNPDARKETDLFIHTDYKSQKGRNLPELAKQIGVDKYIIWNDSYTSAIIGLNDQGMAALYNSLDVFLLLSRREGFCLPVLEAQACGIPVIVNGFSALIERVDGGRCGWLCKPRTKFYSPLNAITSIADPYRGAEALEEAYNKPKKRKYYAKRGLEYARRQTWDIALDKYWLPFLEKIGDEIPRLTSRKKARKIAEG